MPANEYTLYNSPLTVLCRLALPMAVCAALAVALLSEPLDSIPFAIIISGIIFLLAFFLLFIRALLDRRPQLTLSPKGLFIHTKFSENILDGTYRPRKRTEAFYAWRNLGDPTLAPLSYTLTLLADNLPELTEAPPPLPDNATDEQAEAFLAEMGRYADALEKDMQAIDNAEFYSLSLSVMALPHGKRLPKILQSLIDAENEAERLAIIQKLQYKSCDSRGSGNPRRQKQPAH